MTVKPFTIGDSDSISACCPGNRDNKRGKISVAPQELEALDDKRLQAQQQIELYQARITKEVK